MKRAVLLCVLCLASVFALCAAAPAWAFISTGDGGWFWQNPLPQGNALNGVAFPDSTHGWVVGYGTILATSDGGATWTAQDPGTTAHLEGVFFPDATHGWAVGDEGTILATADGGATWTPQYSGTDLPSGITFTLSGVCFPDASHGWVVGRAEIWAGNHQPSHFEDVLSATADGGATWTPQYSGTETLNGVCFPDAGHGWAVGYDYYTGESVILATSDGGATWTAQDPGTAAQLTAVSFPDASHGWAVGYGWKTDVILATSDGGATWTQQNSGTEAALALTAVSFPDVSHGWAVGYGGTVLATTDGGATWAAQSSGTNLTLTGLAFPDASHGWAVGAGGTILATTNGGWPDRTPPTTAVSGVASLWHNTDVGLTLSATDNPGGSGVDTTYYQIDGGPWVEGTSLTVPAPANHANDGLHTVSYYSTDLSGNAEVAKSATVEIDTTKPVISSAYLGFIRQSVHSGWGSCTSHFGLTYRIDDNLSPTAVVKLQALNFRGKVVKTISLGQCATGVQQTYRLPLKLSFLFGHWRVTATDLAGNSQSAPVRFKLFVSR